MARMQPLPIHEVDDEIRHMCEESEQQIGTSTITVSIIGKSLATGMR